MRALGILAFALVAACGGGAGVSEPADPNDAINGEWRFSGRSDCSNTYFDLQRDGAEISGTVTNSPCDASPTRKALQGHIEFPEVVLVWGDPDHGEAFAGEFPRVVSGYDHDTIEGYLGFSAVTLERVP